MTDSIDLDSFGRRILLATRSGKVAWSRTDGDPRAFVASAAGGSIRISEYEVDDAPDATLLEVLDPDGQVIASRVTDPHRPGPWLDWEQILKRLWGRQLRWVRRRKSSRRPNPAMGLARRPCGRGYPVLVF